MISVSVEAAVVIAPIFINFHKELQKDIFLKKTLHLFACFCRYFFQRNSLVSDNDAFLALTFHIDNGVDMYGLLLLLKAFYRNLASVGNLFVLVE